MVVVMVVLSGHPNPKISLCLYGWYSMVVKISFWRRHTLTIGGFAFNHKILGDTKSQRASKSHYWVNNCFLSYAFCASKMASD